MNSGLLFWVLMILTLIFGLWSAWPLDRKSGTSLLVWVLLALLGWKVFGPALHG